MSDPGAGGAGGIGKEEGAGGRGVDLKTVALKVWGVVRDSFAKCLRVIIFAHTCGQSLPPNTLSPTPPSFILSPLGHVGRAQPGTTPGWMSGQELQSSVWGGGRRGWGRGLALPLPGPWRRTVNERVSPPLRQRTPRLVRGERGPAGGSHRSRTPSSPCTLLPSLVSAAGATCRDSISQRALLLQPGTLGCSACWEL